MAGAALGVIVGSLLTAALLPTLRPKEERRTDALRGKVIVFFTAGSSSKREVNRPTSRGLSQLITAG